MQYNNQYLIGQATVITVTITKAGVLTNTSLLVLEVQVPDGTVTTYTYGVGTFITHVSTGVYSATLNLEQSGYWKYRWESASPNTGAVESTFTVKPSIIQ